VFIPLSAFISRSSILKMEAVCYFEMLVTNYQTTRCHNTEDHNMNLLMFILILSVDVGSVTDVSEIYAASILRV
jgi:hypothetical protein